MSLTSRRKTGSLAENEPSHAEMRGPDAGGMHQPVAGINRLSLQEFLRQQRSGHFLHGTLRKIQLNGLLMNCLLV
ncbi:MAG: hypothetical protein ACR2RA_04720 [Geminicoccaceae bacterium]